MPPQSSHQARGPSETLRNQTTPPLANRGGPSKAQRPISGAALKHFVWNISSADPAYAGQSRGHSNRIATNQGRPPWNTSCDTLLPATNQNAGRGETLRHRSPEDCSTVSAKKGAQSSRLGPRGPCGAPARIHADRKSPGPLLGRQGKFRGSTRSPSAGGAFLRVVSHCFKLFHWERARPEGRPRQTPRRANRSEGRDEGRAGSRGGGSHAFKGPLTREFWKHGAQNDATAERDNGENSRKRYLYIIKIYFIFKYNLKNLYKLNTIIKNYILKYKLVVNVLKP